MKSIVIKLPENRWYLGNIQVLDGDTSIYGPVPADGKADNASAAAHGNPDRDPEKAFGDTPYGEFTANIGHVPSDPEGINRRSYGNPDGTGKIPVIWLTPIQGDGTSQAWMRQVSEGLSVNMGLAIHAGPPNAEGELRPTHGCVRVAQHDMDAILEQVSGLPSFSVSIQEETEIKWQKLTTN